MDPQGPSQPSLDTVYDQPDNPAQSQPEHDASRTAAASDARAAPAMQRRGPKEDDSDGRAMMPTSLAYGQPDARHDAGEAVSVPFSTCS